MIGTARERNYQRALAPALKQRAELRLEAGEFAGAATDMNESLSLFRAMGRKEKEPDLYDLRARYLGRIGRYTEAIQAWNDAFALCETFKLHHRSLHMLIGLADLQLRAGDRAGLRHTWSRIDRFTGTHANLPKPTQLRLHLARLDFQKSRGANEEMRRAFATAQRFVRESKLTAFQARELNRYKLDAPPVRPPTFASPAPAVDLQPILATTRVAAGELAHARFVLANPTSLVAEGILRLDAGNLQGQWDQTEQGFKIILRPGVRAASSTSLPLSLTPNTAAILYMEAVPDSSTGTNVVSLSWSGGGTVRGDWHFGAVPDSREVALVNASLAEENPFYSVAFYHELYYRGTNQILQNVKVSANQLCRVELVDTLSARLLAIDANGDGDFEDAGDVLYADADADHHPEFALSPERDVACFELRVYPSVATTKATREEIELILWRSEAGAWVAEAVDVLRRN
jgi:hypothetical protein